MANKQSLPTMNETKSGFINTNAMGNVIAPEYKEQKWATVARLGEGIVGVSNAYKNLKHTEMMAKIDNLAQQNLHKLSDATDPSELPDLINEANKSYDDLFKDDPYGKSFYESDLYSTFKLKNEANVQKTVNALNHQFSTIQATKTGNEISSDIALMNDPVRMSKAIQTYFAQVDGLELNAADNFKLKSEVVKNSFGKLFTNDPNLAVAWYDASKGMYDQYGVDGADIREKAKNYNIAEENRKLENKRKLRAELKATEDVEIEKLTARARLGEDSVTIQKEADLISPRVGNKVAENLKEESNKRPEIVRDNKEISKLIVVDDYEGSLKRFTQYKLDNPDMYPESRTYGDNLLAAIKPEEGKTKRSNEQVKAIADVRIGAATFDDDEKRDIANGDSTVYRDLLEAERQHLVDVGQAEKTKKSEAKQEAKEKKAEADKLAKEKSTVLLANKETELYNVSKDPIGLANFMSSEDIRDLTPDDLRILNNKRIEYIKSLNTEQQKQFEEEQEKKNASMVQKYLNEINSGKYFSNEEFEKMALFLKEEQVNKVRTAQENMLEKVGKESIRLNNNNVISQAYKAWDEGKMINWQDYLNNMKDLTDSEYDKWKNVFIEGNKQVATRNYESALSKVQDKIWGTNASFSEDSLRQAARDLSKFGIKSEAEIFDELVKMENSKANKNESDRQNAHKLLNTYWIAKGAYADAQKVKARQEIDKQYAEKGKADVAEIFKKYHPSESQIRTSVINETSAKYEINNMRNKLFKFVETNEEEGDGKFKYSGWAVNEKVSFTDVRDYSLMIEDAWRKELITPEEYSENMKPIPSAQKQAIDNLLSDPNTLMGSVAVKLKDKLYPITYSKDGTIDLFASQIKDYQRFYDMVNDIAGELEAVGVPLDGEQGVVEHWWNDVREFWGKDRQISLPFLKADIIVNEYLTKMNKNANPNNKFIAKEN